LGSFSELASDEYLLQQVGDAKSVTIIGCPYCTNQSIAYAKDMSIIGKTSLGGLIFKPYATTQEANRIKELFEQKGISADVKIFGPPTSYALCWLNQKDRNKIAKVCENSDAVVSAGRWGIESALPESFRVITGMATVGTISAYLSVEKGKVVLDKDKTKVVRLKETK
jgi:hypothetical protein